MSSKEQDMQLKFMSLVLRLLSLILFHTIVKTPWSSDCENVTRALESFRKEFGV